MIFLSLALLLLRLWRLFWEARTNCFTKRKQHFISFL